MISPEEAAQKAEQWLNQSGKPTDDRQSSAALKETYVVTFSPPPDTLGGDFKVVVDAETGEIIGAMFGR